MARISHIAITILLGGIFLPDSMAQVFVPSTPRQLPSELIDLTAKYQTAMSRIDEPLFILKTSYTEKLKDLLQERRSAGDLEGTVTLQKELDRVAKEGPGEGSSFAPLAELQTIYHQHADKANSTANPNRITVESAYIEALETMMTNYTRTGQLDAGLVTRDALKEAKKRLTLWNQDPETDTPSQGLTLFDWKKLGKAWDPKNFQTTAAVSGNTSVRSRDPEVPEQPALLVGFELVLNPFGSSRETVRGVIPLFRNQEGRITEGMPRGGKKGNERRVVAKDGYVVGGLKATCNGPVRTLTIVFHRLTSDGSDPGDTYESKTYGEWEGGTTAEISIGNKVPVGVDGYYGLGLDQLALIVADP